MKIVRLTAENIKRLRAVEITPDGNTVVIAGRNGQGKTSVLDAIWFALGGGSAMRGTPRPIRDGADEASVTLDLGDIRVTRTWADNKTTLKVESAEGARYPSPQSMLDSLVGRMSFDPLAFAQQDERTQLATLLELVELPFDPAEHDGRRRALYEDRTVVGREVKALEGQLAGLPPADPDVPAEEVSATAIVAELTVAQREVADRADNERRYHAAVERVERARAEFAAAKADMDALAEAMASLPTAPDVAALERQLAEVDQTNAKVRASQQRRSVEARLAEARADYAAKTDAIATLDEEKEAAVATARMPIDGLGFDDNGVTYQGVPFKQASAAEQLRVSLAMAMALNPRIRVIRITDGSLLDSDNMRLIEQMAADGDFQVWVERVDESGRVGVLIEDGEVVARDGAPRLVGADERRREAAEDGFLDNAEPDVPGADDYLAEVSS